MTLVQVLVVLAVVAVVGAVAAGVVRGSLPEPASSLPGTGLPDGELTERDVAGVRFSLAFRGYRMDEVDEVLERLSAELAAKDDELDRLRRPAPQVGSHAASPAQPSHAASHRAVLDQPATDPAPEA